MASDTAGWAGAISPASCNEGGAPAGAATGTAGDGGERHAHQMATPTLSTNSNTMRARANMAGF
jgi:hypothetical protein